MGDNHKRAKPPRIAFEERYIPEPTSGCWLWIGPIANQDGYGTFINKNIGQMLAHRAAWEIYRGPIPETNAEGMRIVVCHKCDVPLCVNPDHLFLGTDKDNVQDSVRKGRHQSPDNPTYKVGAKRHNAKLNPEKVRAIRFLRELDFPTRLLADEFGVAAPTIEAIDQKRIWKHVA